MPESPTFENENDALASLEPPTVEQPPVHDDPPTLDPAPASAPDADPDMFPREYVENLRRENAQYRTRARDYEQAFEGYDDDTRQQLLTYFSLAKRAEAGDANAARELQEWLGDDADDDPDADNFPTTRAEYEEFVRQAARDEAQRLYDERAARQEQEAGVNNVISTAEERGYKFGTPEYYLYLRFVSEIDTDERPDLWDAAQERMDAYHQSIVDKRQEAYLADKERDTMTAPRVAGNGTTPDLSAGPPRSFAEARARMDERLSNT